MITITIIAIAGFAVLLYAYYRLNKLTDDEYAKDSIRGNVNGALLCCAIVFTYFGHGIGEEIEYKRGQIDALTGHIKYELKTQPDRSVEWEEITTYVK